MEDVTSYYIRNNFILGHSLCKRIKSAKLNYPTIISLKLIWENKKLNHCIYLQGGKN